MVAESKALGQVENEEQRFLDIAKLVHSQMANLLAERACVDRADHFAKDACRLVIDGYFRVKGRRGR
jgi:hypothetical protein